MASFIEDLWNSVFTPGPTPALVVATNLTFAVLQILLLALLIATYSYHFLILFILSGGLWFAINWFVRELQLEKARGDTSQTKGRERSPDPDSETETEAAPEPKRKIETSGQQTSSLLHPNISQPDETLRKRRSVGDSSGYASTDSEWEKVSEGDDISR